MNESKKGSEDARKRIEALRRTVTYHAKLYYVDDAPEISDFEYDRFKSGYGAASEDKKGERYLSCDLLIIDDLGAELTNQFTVSAL